MSHYLKWWLLFKVVTIPDRKDTRYTLIVSDNGIGIPENIDFENPETLGLHLVNILVEQLNGEIKLKRDKGTEFVIGLSIEEKEISKKAKYPKTSYPKAIFYSAAMKMKIRVTDPTF